MRLLICAKAECEVQVSKVEELARLLMEYMVEGGRVKARGEAEMNLII